MSINSNIYYVSSNGRSEKVKDAYMYLTREQLLTKDTKKITITRKNNQDVDEDIVREFVLPDGVSFGSVLVIQKAGDCIGGEEYKDAVVIVKEMIIPDSPVQVQSATCSWTCNLY